MEVRIRPLKRRDLAEADRIFRVAFGTFMGVPDPTATFGDRDLTRTRYEAAPDLALAAEADGALVGSNFATNWGSFGFFGPLTVEPKLWDQRIAQRLLERTMDLFAASGCRLTGLFTFSDSPKHAGLYQKFDYWPRFLTPVMARELSPTGASADYIRLSKLDADEKQSVLAACRELTDALYDGLDVSRETRAVESQRLGDTLALLDGSKVSAFAVCHVGAGTEAGSGCCYVKFGAVRPDAAAAETFERLLRACQAFAAEQGASRLEAGVNMSHHEAYRAMLGHCFRVVQTGVAMHQRNDPGFSRPGLYVLNDWR
ncbi:MAG TPA: GNAT family N-acetyltransferase [Candidatus Binataceae bacterium]|nr:GNAT family N-acetyltransferase [Candidatus Binataceae bacterium]